jgi:D-3-phosphoglycerate dehydrogenase
VYDPYVAPGAVQAEGCEPVDLETLLSRADYLSLHLPLTPDSTRLINARTLALMKPSAYLINTARGGLVDEAALLDAVQGGRLAGAALDVLDTEPPPPDHPFLREPRITLTPHNAWYSEQSKAEVCRKGAEEVVRVLRGQPPRAPANQLLTRT